MESVHSASRGDTLNTYPPWKKKDQFSSVQFSSSVMSDFLWPHELQHAKLPCPTPTPRAHPNSCPLSWWCHPTISSSVVPFSSCPQSFPASGSFQMNQLFASGGQSTGVSALASFLPKKSQGWSPSEWTGWTGWISLQSKGLRVFSSLKHIGFLVLKTSYLWKTKRKNTVTSLSITWQINFLKFLNIMLSYRLYAENRR